MNTRLRFDDPYDIDPDLRADQVPGQFPEQFIRTNEAIVLERDGTAVTVGLGNRENGELRSLIVYSVEKLHPDIEQLTFVSVAKADILRMLSDARGNPVSLDSGGADAAENMALDSLANEAPIIHLLNSILLSALRAGSSDVHIVSDTMGGAVRVRVDGLLRTVRHIRSTELVAVSSRVKLVSHLNIMERRLPQDGRFGAAIDNRPFDIRVSIVPTINGESIVLRILEQNRNPIRLTQIGFADTQLAAIGPLLARPNGLVLVTGPTGSGKTTTLNAMLQEINDPAKKIITIEDPVEITITGIDQIQIHEDIGLSFAGLLRRILRQDPDIIMIGEIRDTETAQLTVRAALTGHLVFSTLHTNSSVDAIQRLVDMGVPPYLLASVLHGVVSQRLVRRCCTVCRSTGGHCPNCGGTGYRGRIAVAEVLPITDDLRKLIHTNAEKRDIVDLAVERAGFRPIMEHARSLVESGVTDEAELLRVFA